MWILSNLKRYGAEEQQLVDTYIQQIRRFALKAYRNPKFTTWFSPTNSEVDTRSEKLPLKEIRTITKRFKNSPIPYLTNLLNKHLTKQKNSALVPL